MKKITYGLALFVAATVASGGAFALQDNVSSKPEMRLAQSGSVVPATPPGSAARQACMNTCWTKYRACGNSGTQINTCTNNLNSCNANCPK